MRANCLKGHRKTRHSGWRNRQSLARIWPLFGLLHPRWRELARKVPNVVVVSTASFTSKPLVLFEPRLSVNLMAPQGEAQFQLSDMKGVPLPGFAFDDCEPIAKVDELNLSLRWKDRSLDEVLNQPVRLEAKFRNAQLYAVRSKFHFLDAEDMHLLNDGKPIDPRWFDY